MIIVNLYIYPFNRELGAFQAYVHANAHRLHGFFYRQNLSTHEYIRTIKKYI